MEKIYSKIERDTLICVTIHQKDISSYRTDMCPDSEYIQVCARKLSDKITVPAHRHLPVKRETDITQEVWIVLQGRIKAKFYDLDNSFLHEAEIEKGGCMVLFRGGHSLEVLEEDTLFYEIKTGPYYGVEDDKEFIGEQG